ncbi:helix-turn-helix domain-containing protein, partial [Streptomyces sp. CO7]
MSEKSAPEPDPAPPTPPSEPEGLDVLAVLGASVLRARRERCDTLSTVAAKAGVSPAYISQMESGAANPTVRTLGHVAEALGTTPARLLDPGASAAGHDRP